MLLCVIWNMGICYGKIVAFLRIQRYTQDSSFSEDGTIPKYAYFPLEALSISELHDRIQELEIFVKVCFED